MAASTFPLRFLQAASLALLGAAACGAATTRPNIVFILADDLGWRDLGCYGSPWHRTPHLDRLAVEGLRYTQAYSAAPICSPSRASILTGRSPARLHFEFVTKMQAGAQEWGTPLQSPPYTLDLPLAERTIGEELQNAGYATGFFGKWHVSRHHGSYLRWSPTHGPLQQGFAVGDEEFGSHPYSYPAGEKRGFGEFAPGEFPPDALTDKAIAFVRTPRDRPFFLYLSHYYVHTPVHTRMRWLYDHHRKTLPDPRAAYAAMVETLDHEVGRLLKALDAAGLTENTLVVFTSDNGGHPEYASNAPLRGSKWNLYEGGIRVPLLVRWPGRVPAGRTTDAPMIGTDLYPSFCDAVGIALQPGTAPDGASALRVWEGKAAAAPTRALTWHFPYYHPEGERLFSSAKPDIGIDDFKVSQTRPQSAIRVGDFKLVTFAESGRTELYRLTDDLGEQRDLGPSMPDKVRDLAGQLERTLDAVAARRALPRAAAVSP